MSVPFVDTDGIIRLLTGDDPLKQAAAAALFTEVEHARLVITAPDTVSADAVFVLSSKRLYHLPRPQVVALLAALVRLPGFRVQNKHTVLAALMIYATHSQLDFGDALIVAAMQTADETRLYSYDTDFDRVPGIERTAPS